MKTQAELEMRRRLRRGRQWTSQKLAECADLPRGYVADIEGGRRNPSLRSLLRAANALGVPVQDLFGED